MGIASFSVVSRRRLGPLLVGVAFFRRCVGCVLLPRLFGQLARLPPVVRSTLLGCFSAGLLFERISFALVLGGVCSSQLAALETTSVS